MLSTRRGSHPLLIIETIISPPGMFAPMSNYALRATSPTFAPCRLAGLGHGQRSRCHLSPEVEDMILSFRRRWVSERITAPESKQLLGHAVEPLQTRGIETVAYPLRCLATRGRDGNTASVDVAALLCKTPR